jgi:UDP-galactopyranose mutase
MELQSSSCTSPSTSVRGTRRDALQPIDIQSQSLADQFPSFSPAIPEQNMSSLGSGRPALVVGAGFAGCVVARELADNGRQVVLIDKRPHIGGNAHDRFDQNGVLIHKYGPHIFHTNSPKVFEYLSRFTEWRFYEHRSLSNVGDMMVPFPININTLNMVYGLGLTEKTAQAFLDSVKEHKTEIKNSEDFVLNAIGRDLYEKFFVGYTLKHWGMHPRELKASLMSRVPVRTTYDNRYFLSKYQFMPKAGYNRMFENIIDHSNITLSLDTAFPGRQCRSNYAHLVFTGAISEYFESIYGRLPYRAVRIEHQHLPDLERYQDSGSINYPNQHAYTRVSEFKYLTNQTHPGTTICREYPMAEGEPSYPIPSQANEDLYERYRVLADAEDGVSFVGRLAQYRYYNMDQAVAAALKLGEVLVKKLGVTGSMDT